MFYLYYMESDVISSFKHTFGVLHVVQELNERKLTNLHFIIHKHVSVSYGCLLGRTYITVQQWFRMLTLCYSILYVMSNMD